VEVWQVEFNRKELMKRFSETVVIGESGQKPLK